MRLITLARPVILASASPRRAELLRQIGVAHEVQPADIDEIPGPGEPADAYVRRMALEKARATAAAPDRVVLGADTAVVLGETILGKPRDRDHGLAMLAQLSGRTHRVLSSVAVSRGGTERVVLSVSRVRFRVITPVEAVAYWDSGEPCDKAGGYAIQGLGAVFVARLCGSYSGVMGLPLYETARLLEESGHE